MVGDFALSVSGHDKGKLYVIIAEEADRLVLSDGHLRGLEKPKKKNAKHVQVISHLPDTLREKCTRENVFYNEGIRRALKEYRMMRDTGQDK